jgi:hypothetical protein
MARIGVITPNRKRIVRGYSPGPHAPCNLSLFFVFVGWKQSPANWLFVGINRNNSIRLLVVLASFRYAIRFWPSNGHSLGQI